MISKYYHPFRRSRCRSFRIVSCREQPICNVFFLVVLMIWTLYGFDTLLAIDYSKDVKPILQSKCVLCHGPLRNESGLRLDYSGGIAQGGDRGPSVIAHDIAGSLLMQVIEGMSTDIKRMPEDGEPLSETQIQILRQWIKEGAVMHAEPEPFRPAEHWAYQLPHAINPEPTSWSSNPIDQIIAMHQSKGGQHPLSQAAPATLIRRLYLDLVGIPPSTDEIDQFAANPSDEHYATIVDRLLASPEHAQRWARHWMDVYRYSDWDGYGAEIRESQPHIWRWRDWIVDSLLADRPYDRMICEMIAADELAPEDPNAIRATGFLVRNWYKFNRNSWIENTIEHTGKAFLATTLNCARCHNHMYDPISQKDYYRFRAFLEPHDIRIDPIPSSLLSPRTTESTARVFDKHLTTPTHLFVRGNEKTPDTTHPLEPGLPTLLGGHAVSSSPLELPVAAWFPHSQQFVFDAKKRDVDLAIEMAAKAVSGFSSETTEADRSAAIATLNAALKELDFIQVRREAELAGIVNNIEPKDLESMRQSASLTERIWRLAVAESELAAQSLVVAKAKATDVKKKEQEAAEKGLAEKQAASKKAKAACLSSPTVEFTASGEQYPKTSTGRRLQLAQSIASKTNPLTARVAINHLWLRHFGQPIVGNMFDFGLRSPKPEYQDLLDYLSVRFMKDGWRFRDLHRLMVTSRTYRQASAPYSTGVTHFEYVGSTVRRMEGEVVRDSVLSISGSLDVALGGPDIDPNQESSNFRRSLYFRTSKEKNTVFLRQFDLANVNECYRRTESIVPQQALALSNSELLISQSRRLANRWLQKDPTLLAQPDRFILHAYRSILCRLPSSAELEECIGFLETQSRLLSSPALTAFPSSKSFEPAPSPDPNIRARENLVNVLFNHHDFVTIR